MNWSALAPGILLILLGLSLFLLALLGTGRKKTFTVPIINASFSAPDTQGKKFMVGLIGIVFLIFGAYLMIQPNQPMVPNTNQPTESPIKETIGTADDIPSTGSSNLNTTPSETLTPVLNIAPSPSMTESPVSSPVPDIAEGCISSTNWTPLDGGALSKDGRGCWNLIPWGMAAEKGGLLMKPASGGKSHGIYQEIPSNVRISLNVKLDRMQTTGDLEPRILIGLVPLMTDKTEPGLSDGKYLVLKRYNATDPKIYLWLQDPTNLEGGMPLSKHYDIGQTASVVLDIKNNVMTLYLDNEKIDGQINLPEKNALWIGYDLPNGTGLQAFFQKIAIGTQ